MVKLSSLAALALAAAAVGIALFAGRDAPPPPPPPPAAAEPPGRAQGQLRALERRIELLEESNGYLERKVFELEQAARVQADGGVLALAPAPAPGAPGATPQGTFAPALAGPLAREELKAAVRAAQEELAQEQRLQRLERLEREHATSQAELQARWKRFALEANLNGSQEQELQRALDAEAARRSGLFEELRSGKRPFSDLRPELREGRRATDQAMAKVLTPEQLSKYTAVRREERRDARGGRGGGPGGAEPGAAGP